MTFKDLQGIYIATVSSLYGIFLFDSIERKRKDDDSSGSNEEEKEKTMMSGIIGSQNCLPKASRHNIQVEPPTLSIYLLVGLWDRL